jgi:hypothetical protein
MLKFIYSKKYGWNPLKFLLKGENFYKQRKTWIFINNKLKFTK